MKRFFIALLLAFVAAACSQQEVTVITWNVGAFSKYSEDSTQEVAQLLCAEKADYVGLNELDSCNRRHNHFQLEKLAEAAGFQEFRFGRAIPFAGGAYGNGVLSAHSIERSFLVPLPVFNGSEERSLVVVETPQLVFASTHLDFQEEETAAQQAALINDWFTLHYTGYDKPVILCGDMNCQPGGMALQELSRLWDVLTPPSPTYSDICIDYILSFKTARPVKVKAAQVLDNTTASDHRPVKLRFRVGPARKSLTFVHATDPQIGFIDSTPGYAQSDALMGAAVRAWNAMKPSAVILTGDLINQPADSLQNAIYNARKAEITVPVYEIPGNHDIMGWTPGNRDHYLALRGYQRFSFIQDDCAFIGIDSNCIKDGAEDAEKEQLAWLKEQLAAAAGCQHKLLFLHCPIFKEAADEAEDYFSFPLPKRAEYLALLKKYGVEAVFAGHTHMEYCTLQDGILFATAGPVGSPLGRGYSGFAVVNVSPDGTLWEYVATPE